MAEEKDYIKKIKKWLKEPAILREEEDANVEFIRDEDNNCDIILTYDGEIIKCIFTKKKVPIKLSNVEYEVLEWIQKEYSAKYIVRNKDGELFATKLKPDKNWNHWGILKTASLGNIIPLDIFQKLFQFVKWENDIPTDIEEVLNNCEIKKEE